MFRFNSRRRDRDGDNSTHTSDGSNEPSPSSATFVSPVGATASSQSSTQHSSQTRNPPGGRNTVVSGGEYARRCRALMSLLRDLRNLGADSVFDLPKIVVIGSQSAGKSSLIEAVTGINVPRDRGTCTRCPMECTMSSAATSWTCSISLRSGAPGQVSPAERFGPDITRKEEVELWLRRAQGAILSTDVNKTKWLTKSAAEIKQAINDETGMREFTEDTIVVDIRDQGLTDLSFVDLPGLIQNANQESIDLIKDLSLQYIEGENTLILVTIPVSDDIQNQGAVVLAKTVDTEGRRTIGVLTKPDQLGAGAIGSHSIWRQTMENVPGSRDYLQHGYYCVRFPDDQRRQQGYTAHNLPDPNYFDVTSPWKEVVDRGRFGVNNLVQDISALLTHLIEANLPRLRAAVEEALRLCMDRLARLPPLPVGEPGTRITMMINEFIREIEAASVGNSHKTLAQGCRSRYVLLRGEILATCPVFRNRNASDDDRVYDISAVRQLIEESTGWELPGFIPYETYECLIQRFVEEWETPTETCFEDIYHQFSTFVDDLSESHFAGYRNLRLFVGKHARAELEKNKAETEAAVRKLLDVERKPFFSQRSNFSQEQNRWMQEYYKVFYGVTPYKYRDELHVMATVRSYFQFAYERFSDTMLLMVEHELVQALRPNLETALFNDLAQILRQGSVKSLLSEDPNSERDRRELTNRRERLVEIRNRLDAFSMS